nr:aminotransferase class I/II-fold pyridoxal phosphate-dependent enzyme [Akkermansia muciniphila]
MWLRRQCTKFNGVPYIVQRGAAAVFSPEGMTETKAALRYYKENARIMAEGLKEMGVWFTGGQHCPYLWMRCPYSMGSWQFFDALLSQCAVVGTPGAGFGKNGEGFFRLTARMVRAFGKR